MAFITKLKILYADIIAALGFTPENAVNKGAENGYAPLDGNAKLPLANLANTTVSAGVYGNATQTPQYTVDAQGRLTTSSNVTITPAFSSVTGKPTTLAGYGIIDAQPLDSDLTAIAALSPLAGNFIVGNGTSWIQKTPEQTRTSLGLGTISLQNSNNVSITGGVLNITSGTQILGNLSMTSNAITSTQVSDDILITPTGIGALKIENRITLENILSFGPLDPQGSYMAVNAEYLQSGPLSAWQYLQNGEAIKYEFANDGALTVFTAPAGLAGDFILSWTQVFQIPNSGIIDAEYGGTGLTNANSTLAITGNASISGSNTGDQIITLTGDVTGSGTGNFATILANTTVAAGTYGSATKAPQYTVDAQGRLTASANVTITPAFSSITSTPTTLAGYGITDAQTELNGTGFVKANGTTISYDNTSYLPTNGGTIIGQLISTKANDPTTNGGQISLRGTGGNRIDFSATAFADPTFTTRSVGTKITLWPSLSATTTDYAIGVGNATIWVSLPDATTTSKFKVYGGTTETFSVDGAGDLAITGTATAAQFIKSGGTSSQFLKADGSVDSTAYQPLDGDLTAIAALTPTEDNFIVGNGTAWTQKTPGQSRISLGLGTIATQNANSVAITGGKITGITDLAIADGGTGASTQQGALNAIAGATTSGQYLRGNGSNVTMSEIQAADIPILNQSTTGNAATATALQTARNINGVAFNGTADITVADSTKLSLTGGTLTGQLVSTKANDTATGGGQIHLNGATGNRLDFNSNGVAYPALTTRSVGTKIVLYPSISASSTDYALGIGLNAMWLTVPSSASKFSFYSAKTEIFTINGAGDVIQNGEVFFNQSTPTSKSAPAVLTAAELQSRIIRFTGTVNTTLTYPTGTTIDAGLPAEKINNTAFDFSLIHTGTGTVTLAANTGVTLIGSHSVSAGESAMFRIRRTASNTFVSYRIS